MEINVTGKEEKCFHLPVNRSRTTDSYYSTGVIGHQQQVTKASYLRTQVRTSSSPNCKHLHKQNHDEVVGYLAKQTVSRTEFGDF